MKRTHILVVFFVMAITTGMVHLRQESAQGIAPAFEATKSAARPESSTPQTLPFSQDWTADLLTANDDWSAVPGIIGFRGDDITTTTGVDARTLFAEAGPLGPVIDVNINQVAPDTFSTGGVAEFEIANRVVALSGSGTADAPNIVLYLNTTGQNNVRVSYNIRDLDASADNAIQQVNTQYRVGNTGNFINVPGGYVADATTGPGTATLVTPVAVTLPPLANNQPEVQVRILTTNAVGNDEWVGIDDINVTLNGPPSTARANLDFNGDGRTDYTVTRPSGVLKTWYVATNGSSATLVTQWGLATDRDAPADYDGDGKTDIAVWRDGPDPDRAYFFILLSSSGALRLEQFGRNGDMPQIVGDYDGDGKADVAVFRQTGTAIDPCGIGKSVFYYRPSATPATNFNYVCWGQTGDVPTGGDFDGDGKFDFCVRRDFSSPPVIAVQFLLRRSSDSGMEAIYFGFPTDAIMPGDYDGDGRYDFAIARHNGSTAEIYILERDGGGTGSTPFTVGNITANDFLAPGDYDGDSRQDVSLWRGNADPAMNFFVIRRSSTSAFAFFNWGQSGDEPAGEWNVTGGGP